MVRKKRVRTDGGVNGVSDDSTLDNTIPMQSVVSEVSDDSTSVCFSIHRIAFAARKCVACLEIGAAPQHFYIGEHDGLNDYADATVALVDDGTTSLVVAAAPASSSLSNSPADSCWRAAGWSS